MEKLKFPKKMKKKKKKKKTTWQPVIDIKLGKEKFCYNFIVQPSNLLKRLLLLFFVWVRSSSMMAHKTFLTATSCYCDLCNAKSAFLWEHLNIFPYIRKEWF